MTAIVHTSAVAKLIKKDSLFAEIKELYGVPPNWSRPADFVSLVRIILEQQVSLASALAHFAKLEAYLPSFTPKEILRLSDEEMRACQISKQKTVYLRALSTAIAKGDLKLEELHTFSDEEVRGQLIAIKGIGNWTADVFLMFCLQSRDIFPGGDIALINTVKELKLVKTQDEVLEIAAEWKPYRSLAAFFLWHYYLNKRNKAHLG